MYESRWYDCGNAYRVLVMDPATSGVTWEAVSVRGQELACIMSPQVVDGVLFVAPWGYEGNHDPANLDPVAQAAHIEMCKRETLLLAQAAFAPQTPPVVTLRS